MEVPKKFTKFQFEIVKKEPVSEDEIDNEYENYFHPVKQVHYFKPELNLDYWNKKPNIDNIDSKNIDGFCNIYSKLWCLWNPIVLLERLPNSALNRYSRLNVIGLKTENLCTEIDNFDTFSENTSIEPEGECVTLEAEDLSDTRVHPIHIKASGSLKKGQLTAYGRNAILQCDSCSFVSKQKSTLQKHIWKVHSFSENISAVPEQDGVPSEVGNLILGNKIKSGIFSETETLTIVKRLVARREEITKAGCIKQAVWDEIAGLLGNRKAKAVQEKARNYVKATSVYFIQRNMKIERRHAKWLKNFLCK